MLDLTENDKEFISQKYLSLLNNISSYLECITSKAPLEYSKRILIMLHQGLFSINNKIIFSSSHNYLYLPSLISSGVEVTLGICCCRHTSSFISDIYNYLNISSSYLYIKINKDGNWQVVSPSNANHVVVLLTINNQEYLIDPRNKLILLKDKNGNLTNVPIEPSPSILDYQDQNITDLAKTLKKYYTYRDLGITHIYDYH